MYKAIVRASAALALLCQWELAAAGSYQLNFLPVALSPAEINNAGTVLGTTGDASRSVFSWSSQKGLTKIEGVDIGGVGMNDQGVIVGAMPSYQGDEYIDTPRRITPDGTVTDLANYNATLPYSGNAATAINNRGQVAGALYQGIWEGTQAVRWEADGSITKLGSLGNYSYAYDINNAGTVVGYALQGFGGVGFVADGASSMTAISGALPRFGAGNTNWTIARAINDAGSVVGESGYQGEYATITDAFIWDEQGGMRPLMPEGMPDLAWSSASDINASGAVVGSYRTVSDYADHAFLWTADGGLVTLDTMLSSSQQAVTRLLGGASINDQGQIAGWASVLEGGRWVDKAYVLSPVPEPATAASLSIGLVALGILARRRPRLAPDSRAV